MDDVFITFYDVKTNDKKHIDLAVVWKKRIQPTCDHVLRSAVQAVAAMGHNAGFASFKPLSTKRYDSAEDLSLYQVHFSDGLVRPN